jgi:hypothetical protein
MKQFIALLLAFGVPASFAADRALSDGWHERKALGFGHNEIVVRAEIGQVTVGRCAGWRWGAENECPRSALVALTVSIGREQIFVPWNAYADLGTPVRIDLKPGSSSLDLVVKGGDAATAYTATLKFSPTRLKRRKVFGNEFKHTAWEEVTYSFPN